MADKGGAAGQIGLLLVFLALVGGAGAWNYQRNLEREEAEHRPYRSYREEDLDALLEAYGAEQEQARRRYESRASRRASAESRSYLDEQVQEFERVQRVARSKRVARNRLAYVQATVKLLEEEKRRREEERNRLALFWRRLTTL